MKEKLIKYINTGVQLGLFNLVYSVEQTVHEILLEYECACNNPTLGDDINCCGNCGKSHSKEEEEKSCEKCRFKSVPKSHIPCNRCKDYNKFNPKD